MRHPFFVTILISLFIVIACGHADKKSDNSSVVQSQSVDSSTLSMSRVDSIGIKTSWDELIKIVRAKNFQEFNKISLDWITACHTKYEAKIFFQKCINEIFDSTLLRQIERGEVKCYPRSTNQQIQVTKKQYPEGGAWTVTFGFVKTSNGYEFSESDSFGGPICCR